MIPLWIILTLAAAFFWAVISLLDKFIVSHELKDPLLATVVSGFATVLVLLTMTLFLQPPIFVSLPIILILLFGGISYVLATYFYFLAVRKAEISRVISFLSMTPIFVLFFAFVFLGERLTSLNYFGIILLVFGSFLISLKKNHSEYNISKAFFIVILASLFLSLRDLVIKFASINVSIWSALFWLGVGTGLTSLFLLAKHHPHLKKKSTIGIRHLLFGRIISSIGLLLFLIAISLASVSLVSALAKIQILIVFIGTLVLSNFHPHILKEKITASIVIQKIVAIVSILIGAFLLI